MIFLTGHHGAGKTTVAEILTNYNFIYIDLGGILRKKHQEEDPEISFESWCEKNENIKGLSFTDDVIVGAIKNTCQSISLTHNPPRDLVVVGSRSITGIQYIIEKIPSFNGCKNFIVYIDASIDDLMQRYCDREGKRFSLDEFNALLERDVQIGLPSIISCADIRIFNNGSMQKLEEMTEKLIINQLGYKK